MAQLNVAGFLSWKLEDAHHCLLAGEALIVGFPVDDFELLLCLGIPEYSQEDSDMILIAANELFNKTYRRGYKQSFVEYPLPQLLC